MMEEEKYTIEDLRTGKVGIILTKNKKRFEKIVREAFPKDKFWMKYETLGSLCLGGERISYNPDVSEDFLWSDNYISIPYVSEKDFVLPDDAEKLTWESLLEEFRSTFVQTDWLVLTAKDFQIYLDDHYKCKVKEIK